jgi:hypothetical protein
MPNENHKTNRKILWQVLVAIFGSPWLEVLAEGLKLGRRLWRGLAEEGMYEVLEYEATLELQDSKGKRAHFHKRQKVRYLQSNIISYRDQAWGDGQFLENYRCSPGEMADTWREGHKTLILISRREVKQKGEIDEYIIERDIVNGFLHSNEPWGTEVSHRTKNLKIQVMFPNSRPPTKLLLIEAMRQRSRRLENAVHKLPDGRFSIKWETDKPRLYERYILSWEW